MSLTGYLVITENKAARRTLYTWHNPGKRHRKIEGEIIRAKLGPGAYLFNAGETSLRLVTFVANLYTQTEVHEVHEWKGGPGKRIAGLGPPPG